MSQRLRCIRAGKNLRISKSLDPQNTPNVGSKDYEPGGTTTTRDQRENTPRSSGAFLLSEHRDTYPSEKIRDFILTLRHLRARGLHATLDIVRSKADKRYVARLYKVSGNKRVHMKDHDRDAQILIQVINIPSPTR